MITRDHGRPGAAYPAHAHIAINIPDGATDLFDGSIITDVDGPGAAPFSITAAGPFASTNGGSVTIAGNGSFSYNPPPGFTGANDTFTLPDLRQRRARQRLHQARPPSP